VIPDLAIRAFAVPAKVAVRNRVEGQVLKAAQQPIIFGDLDAPTEDFNRNEFFERIEEIALYWRGWHRLKTLFRHRGEYSVSLFLLPQITQISQIKKDSNRHVLGVLTLNLRNLWMHLWRDIAKLATHGGDRVGLSRLYETGVSLLPAGARLLQFTRYSFYRL
jgi:hypothetical protein